MNDNVVLDMSLNLRKAQEERVRGLRDALAKEQRVLAQMSALIAAQRDSDAAGEDFSEPQRVTASVPTASGGRTYLDLPALEAYVGSWVKGARDPFRSRDVVTAAQRAGVLPPQVSAWTNKLVNDALRRVGCVSSGYGHGLRWERVMQQSTTEGSVCA